MNTVRRRRLESREDLCAMKHAVNKTFEIFWDRCPEGGISELRDYRMESATKNSNFTVYGLQRRHVTPCNAEYCYHKPLVPNSQLKYVGGLEQIVVECYKA